MSPHAPPIPCTVGLLTFNSVAVLERALDATEEFAERVICDGGSTDGTVELALRRRCVVLRQQPEFQRDDGSLRDFAGAMNQLIDSATQPWFFKVDSDEMPSLELVGELRNVLSSPPSVDGFTIPMKYVVRGSIVQDASTYPMRQLRIVRTDVGLRYARSVHESIDTVGRTIGALTHPQLLPQWPVSTLIQRWWRYLRIEADTLKGEPLAVRWRSGGRSHAKAVRYFVLRNIDVIHTGTRPRLPLRYEVLRIANHLVGIVVLLIAPIFRGTRKTRR